MTNFVANNVSSGNIIYAADHNELGSRIAAVLNGGLDDNNVSSLSGTKVVGATLPSTALDALTAGGWVVPSVTFTYNANNGGKEFVLTPSADPTGFLTAGMKLRLTRGTSPPTQCMAFTAASSQYATKASPSGMTGTSTFTAEAWVYLNSYTTGGIISRDSGGASGGWTLAVTSSGQLTLIWRNASGASQFTSYQSVPLKRWVHVAGVATNIGSPAASLYLNGISIPAQTASSAATTRLQSGSLQVGAFNTSNFFDGYIAEARYWSTAQSQSNIQSNMAISLSGSESNLVALFQGNGNFNDKTANANNLTATNSASATQAANPYNSTEYGIITKVASNAVTVFTGTDYMIPNMTLSSPYYSTARAPFGFPVSRRRWMIQSLLFGNYTTSSPTSGTWVNALGGGACLTLPTGEWEETHSLNVIAQKSGNGTAATVATVGATSAGSDNAESDVITEVNATGSANATNIATVSRTLGLTAAIATPLYLNYKATQSSMVTAGIYNGDGGTSKVEVISAYI